MAVICKWKNVVLSEIDWFCLIKQLVIIYRNQLLHSTFKYKFRWKFFYIFNDILLNDRKDYPYDEIITFTKLIRQYTSLIVLAEI